MSTTREFHGWVNPDGKVQWDYPSVVQAFRKHLAGTDGNEITAQFYKRRSKRSTRANAYYWGVVIPLLASEIGYTQDEMHEALKAKFLSQEDLTHGLVKVRSSAKLSVAEFGEYLETVTLWAAEKLGVVIPQPEVEKPRKSKAA